jgi:4-hydroxy-3-methylbut-2-enyl diphosphate reductase
MALKITVSKTVGFCAGVQTAVKKAKESARIYGHVAMLGDIVHNEKVVDELNKLGVEVVKNIDQIDISTPVLFRSHGTPAQIWQAAQAKGLTIIDATCPLVREIHQEARMLAAEGRRVIIIGDRQHDEVEGIASQVEDPIIVANQEEAERLSPIKKVGVVVQSTQNSENVAAIVAILSAKVEDLHFVNTICRPTRQRQEQIRELARQNDVILVVGSKNSANTRRLFEIAKKLNKATYLVADTGDIQKRWFAGKKTVGVATGASTPEQTMTAVVKKISQYS